jgi:Zn-finger in ubiquitin-hydrolases and other protein
VAATCTHLDQIQVLELPDSVDGCEDCLRDGTQWMHLRICLSCGHVGCCDDSPNHYATDHARGSGHVLLRSLEPGEQWSWCFADEVAFVVPEVKGQTRIPPSPMLS